MSMIEEDKRLELARSPTNTIRHHRTPSTTIVHLQQGFAIGNGLSEPGIQFKADYQSVKKHQTNVSYDLRKQRYDDLSKLDEFLNLESVKKALGVPEEIHFGACNGEVYQAMKEDIMRNLEVRIPVLLEDGIQMLVYAGEYDFICNWLELS
ncbi:hypothetical protein Lser_V15G36882 [Lactuca serriola]